MRFQKVKRSNRFGFIFLFFFPTPFFCLNFFFNSVLATLGLNMIRVFKFIFLAKKKKDFILVVK